MNRVVHVHSIDEWKDSIPTLGQGDHAVTVWQVRNEAEASADAVTTSAAFDAHRLREEHVPKAAAQAAFLVAQQSGRYNLPDYKGFRTNPASFGGHNHPLSGLHADTHIEDGRPKSAAYKCLYVGAGVVEAYFRLLPVNFLTATPEEKDEMLGDRAVMNPKSVTKMAMAPGVENEFLRIIAPAGTLLAFTAAGNPEVGAAPAEHEIRSLSEYRVSIPMEDYLFRRAA